MGSGGPSTASMVEAADVTRSSGGTRKIGPTVVPKAMSSTNSATLAVAFKIKGVNYSISSACATSVHCIGAAAEQIQWGKQDIVFAGGGEDLHWTMANLFDAMGAMATRYNETPASASRAYDKNRDGFIIAGGAGVVVLEEMGRAKARGANILGEIIGYYANSDGDDMVQLSGEGAVRCMNAALAQTKRPIDYVNTHGTSTPVGDSKETASLREVFGSKIPPFSSTKSLTGHSLGAVGAQETIYSLIMMRDRFLVESAHIEELDPEFEGLPIIRQRIDNAKVDTFLTNSFGFGGTNGCLIVGRPD
jgi:3-oxoacyl-[acyl-carrier-protein] synthase-1